MAFPSQNTSVVSKGLALLTSMYRTKPNIVALLTAMLQQVQDLENAVWATLESMLLASPPTGPALDQIGDLVKCPRSGFSDAQYLIFVIMTIRARRSGGRSEDIIQVVALAILGATFAEFYPAAFFVSTLNMSATWAAPIGVGIRTARDPGVRGVYVWSSWPNSGLFYLGDSVGPVAGSGLQDHVSGSYPFGLASAIGV